MRKIYESELPDGRIAELYESENGAPAIYIDGAWGTSFSNDGTCRVNLFTSTVSGDASIERRDLSVRLIMSYRTFIVISEFFNKRIEELKKQGMLVEVEQEVEIPLPPKAETSKKSARRRRKK